LDKGCHAVIESFHDTTLAAPKFLGSLGDDGFLEIEVGDVEVVTDFLDSVFEMFNDFGAVTTDVYGNEKGLTKKGLVVELFAGGLNERGRLEIVFAVCEGNGNEVRHVAECSGEGVFGEFGGGLKFVHVEVIDFCGLVTDVVTLFYVEEEKALNEMARDDNGGNEIVALDILVRCAESVLAVYHLEYVTTLD
jgi:hypothetical protein